MLILRYRVTEQRQLAEGYWRITARCTTNPTVKITITSDSPFDGSVPSTADLTYEELMKLARTVPVEEAHV